MSNHDRTRQQLDPAGSTGLRFFTSALLLGAFTFALVYTVKAVPEITVPALAIASLLAIAAAVALIIVRISPYRTPMSQDIHFVAIGLVLAGIFLFAASMWGTDRYVRDDWGSIVAGLVLLALGPYRPAREIVFSGVATALFVGVLVLLESGGFRTNGPVMAFVIVAVTPLLVLCFGGAAYSVGIVNSIESWQRRAGEAAEGELSELRGSIARSVQRDRVTILGQDVLPFFSEVMSRSELTDADRLRALEIAGSIRSVMVAEANRSWLENLVESSGVGSFVEVNDRNALASTMTIEQRTALRTLLVSLIGSPGGGPKRLVIRLSQDGELVRTTITVVFAAGEVIPRARFAPYFALVSTGFDSFEADFGQTTLRLRFWYEQQ